MRVCWNVAEEFFVALREIGTKAKKSQVNNILHHAQHESAATTAHTEQDVTYGNHKESDLKNGVDIF